MRSIVRRSAVLILMVVAAFTVSAAKAPSASACTVWCWGLNLNEGSAVMQWWAQAGDEGITPLRAAKVTIIRSSTSWDDTDFENLDDGVWMIQNSDHDFVGGAESKHAEADDQYLLCDNYTSAVKFGSFWMDSPTDTGGCLFDSTTIGPSEDHTYGVSRCASTGHWCTFNENGNEATFDLTSTMGSTASESSVGEDIYCDFDGSCTGLSENAFIRSNHGYCGDSSCAGDLNYKISDEGESGGGDWTIETAANIGIEAEKDCQSSGSTSQWAYDPYAVNSTWDIHWKTNGTDC